MMNYEMGVRKLCVKHTFTLFIIHQLVVEL